jgi:tRNA threonylcarbamoyladenosine biosynthesis protein TsaE
MGKTGQENGQISLYHFDLYRIKSVDELYGIGIDEYLYDEGICLLEWADRFEDILPQNTKFVRIEILSETERRITSTLKQ